jgi:N-acetyl sugar amidotransferase
MDSMVTKVIDVPRTTKPYTGDGIVWCQNCVMSSTRPRIEFDERGWCNACVWREEKNTIVDWDGRWKKLEELCNTFRKKSGFDCIVGVSGGKDGSYVAHMLKRKLGMHPLTITVSVPLSMQLGNENLERFKASGFDHIQVTPNPVISQKLNRIGFIEQGRPLFGWQINLQVCVLRSALAFNIPFIMYGEDGEVEYGGSTETKNQWAYSVEYATRVYLSGQDPLGELRKIGADQYDDADVLWWKFPPLEEIERVNPQASHFSYFEDWDPYDHYLIAKEHCGLQEREDASSGTYTNFAQTDTSLFDLHMYLAYLKFGWGRCSQDAGIDIRRGAMTRKQAIELVKVYDWQPLPDDYIKQYCDYFQLTRQEFDDVIDKHANKKVLEKVDGVWKPKLTIK